MRILQIRFKNLNSLEGCWQIDLTHPAFVSDGIFAITGPTGAGKTTILDAICLALYGRTPRLGKITRSGNEIMSRQTGECFAEVIFATQSGRYRCHWSQHRARKRPDGELQAPKHEIADAVTGKLVESRIKGVADQIEQVTGLDFERFTRSMLLAQGDFAAFLQAAPDDRAPILEQITGTEIYSRLSIRVHERKQQALEKLNLLQTEAAGITFLEPEQEREIRQMLETKRKEAADLAARLATTKEAIAWLTTIDGLKKEIINLADEADRLRRDMEAFRPIREKLNKALQAAEFSGRYATLTAIRQQQADDRADLKVEQEALAGLEASVRVQAEILKAVEQHSIRVKAELKTAMPMLQKIRLLDQKLADWRKAILDSENDCRQEAARIDANLNLRLGIQEKRARACETRDCIDAYLEEHAQDEWLISGLAGVEDQLRDLLSRQKEIAQKVAAREAAAMALAMASKTLEERRKQTRIWQQTLERTSMQLQQGKDTLDQLLDGHLLREYRTEKESLLREMIYLTKIAELEDHRARLEEGKPCPLCGATEHPFRQGNIPVPDQIEQRIDALTRLIGQAEEQEATIKKLEDAERLARMQLTDAEKLESAAVHDQQAAEKALAEVKDSVKRLQTDFAERRQAVATRLAPLGMADITKMDIASLIETLTVRLKSWQAQVKQKADIEKRLADLDSELKRLDAVIETQNAALAKKMAQLHALQKELAAGCNERCALYGDKSPDEEERRLNQAVWDAENAEKQAREHYGMLQQQWSATKAHIDALTKRIGAREMELKKREADFFTALAFLGFSDENQFLAAILPSEQRAELTAMAKDLDARQIALYARQQDREMRLAREIARNLTDEPLAALLSRLEQQEEALKAQQAIMAGFEHELMENEVARERMKAKQAAIDSQKKECRRWEALHELIGSADGKKYRNFAQGLTFEIMIGHANRQLQKMTDRYLLIRDDTQPLELNVIDNYQAGEIRSTKNLSGGESFIVSLSLALGLSRMVSKNVRVDSLFLDEGFGTLDEETLDIALEVLAGLPQDGKLIGVISHVPALKERIATQIEVILRTGGRSELSGPGCSQENSAG